MTVSNMILISIIIILLITMIILIRVIIHKNKEYTLFQSDTTQNYIFLITFAEFIMYTKSHTDNKIVTNDMINAIKTCINRGLYETTLLDSGYAQDDVYTYCAEQMFKFAEKIDEGD